MLGRNYEMSHQNTDIETEEHELYVERRQAVERLAQTAMYVSSVDSEFQAAQAQGEVPDDLWRASNEAHIAHLDAIGWLLNVNRRISMEGL